jgi:hypothetical protein
MLRYIYCASNESIPGILYISYHTYHIYESKRTLKNVLDEELNNNLNIGKKFSYVFVKKFIKNNFNEYFISFYKLLQLKFKNVLSSTGEIVPELYHISIKEAELLFDIIQGDYIDYLFEDSINKKELENKIKDETEYINKKEIEDRIINNHFKTLEDILEKKKADLNRLDTILNEMRVKIANNNQINLI